MKRKSIVLLCIVLCLIIFGINVSFSDAQEKINLFDEILLETKGEISEYGLKVKFETRELPKEVCNYLFQTLDFDNKEIKSRIFENENFYSVEFSGRNIKGNIQSLKNNNKDVITVNISKVGNKNGLVSLKNKVSVSIGYRGENIKYYQYLKAKIGEDSENIEEIYSVNESIIKILESHGSKNIETVSINSGLSTVAYTKNYDVVVNNNKLIDFNYAVCNYSSGRYIIIGTPEIITTY
ncbi:YwmB family TATA-box binding protein [Clostridium sp.]|uniref:YwmB family TATA-box binding protein n=1 Tax=Clostridium sp. TaxID=1506 RepID=UPI001A5CA599|nr:YwmB family TATA-box binding protein [Clostridium sp.]MBK5240184.1 YwmB family TATA-box binding protein [Clostridium sp.]